MLTGIQMFLKSSGRSHRSLPIQHQVLRPEKPTAHVRNRPRHRTSTLTPQICEHWLPSLTSQQFQALLNYHFWLLFIFPSQYLFAIGLSLVFSLIWNLPHNLSCNPKQLDSTIQKSYAADQTKRPRTGVSPSLRLFSKRLQPQPLLTFDL